MTRIDSCRRSGRWTVDGGVFVALAVVAFGFDPRSMTAPASEVSAVLPGLGGLSTGETTPLKNGVARSLIYDARKLEPLPADEELRAFQLEKERGVELASLYRKAAPSVVLLLAGESFGSGFVINKDGWLLTNHHVARGGMLQNDLSRQLTVVFGNFNDQGSMEPLHARYRAEVYKWDQVRDLALLKLKDMPSWAAQTELPVIRIAEKTVSTGDDVAAIGNAGCTLLWSIKPGVVQGVGRRLSDLASDLARRELRAEQSSGALVGSQPSDIEKELEQELQPMRNVLVVQATCPIMHGDSGGPLLEVAQGRAIGITSYCATESAGTAHFFIHSSEIRDFVNNVPTRPMQALSSFWEVAANACAILDLDTNVHPDTVVLSKIVRSSAGLRTNAVAIGWDLAEVSDLKPFLRRTQTGSAYDFDSIIRAKAMHLQMYLLRDNNTTVCAYDLDNDGHFGVVRLGLNGAGFCESELYSEGPDKPYELRKLSAKQGVLVDASRLPEGWRARYEKVVLPFFKGKKAD